MVVIGVVAFSIAGWVMFFKLFRHEDNDYRNIAESEEHSADVTSTDITSTDETDDISGVIGGWESKAYYEFREDGTYGWYKSSQDLNDNYYSGTYSVIRGYEACEHLGITFDKIITVIVNSEGQITLDDIYCITCSPTYLVSGGVDKSDTLNGMSYEMLFVVTGEKSAQGKLISNYDTYYFTKIK